MFSQRKFYVTAIVASTLLITYLHYSTVSTIHALHDIYREFYYIPVLVGALVFGLKGSVLTYLLIFALYLPYILMNWSYVFISELNNFLHLILQGLFAFFAGFLIERNRRHRDQIEKNRRLADIGQVAASIVHDLKNPLITILGFAQRIQDGKGNTDTAVQAIIDSARNMQRIVFDVLDVAKQFHFTFREEDVRGIINRACDICKTKAEGREVLLSIDLPHDFINISADRHYMERALINILNNAIDASERGQNVFVRAEPEKDCVSIKIKDQGTGMDREVLKNVFTPFYTKKKVGTGIGMPIAKKIIEGHQGRIYIKTQPETGTEVIIELPYKMK